jgi:hypothetical protein
MVECPKKAGRHDDGQYHELRIYQKKGKSEKGHDPQHEPKDIGGVVFEEPEEPIQSRREIGKHKNTQDEHVFAIFVMCKRERCRERCSRCSERVRAFA